MSVIIDGTKGTTTPGLYTNSAFTDTYADGVVIDYTSTLGRITTGTADALAFYNGGTSSRTELMRLDSSGNVLVGNTNSSVAKMFVNGYYLSGGQNYIGAFSDGVNSTFRIAAQSGLTNLITDVALGIYTQNTERMRIDTSGNVLVVNTGGGLGYGTGAGGSVTQTTSKSTTVTLNTPTGRVTTHNASLAGNTSVAFIISNTLVSVNDNVVVTICGANALASMLNYNVWAYPVNGNIYIGLRNITAGALAEAITINFAIIKGAVS